MPSKRRNLLATGFFVLFAGLLSGCDTADVGTQARASLSSFVTGIVNGVISDAINGND